MRSPSRLLARVVGVIGIGLGVAASLGGCSNRQALASCARESWEGECQLTSVTKVEDAEFPIPHVVFEAVYRPIASPRYPGFTPGAIAQRTFAKAEHEVPLYDYLEAHPRVRCRTETTANSACVSPKVAISLAPFDPAAAARTSAAPPVTGCAQIEATSTQDKLQGGQQTQTFVSQRIQFGENSAELPPDADAVTGEVAQLLSARPTIECLGIVGQIASGEPPALAERRAKAVRDLLGAHGVAVGRLLTIGVTAKVFGNGARPEAGDPADRKVGFSVLLEGVGKP
jgi:outer membrane protein OmpA-like peptidoglycan-associated protein